MKKVYLIKDGNGDTRTAHKNVTWEECQESGMDSNDIWDVVRDEIGLDVERNY